MNFQEALENLFTFNNSTEAIIFGVILFLTFLLGMIIWALLVQMPKSRRLKKDIKLLRGELDTLSANHKELEDKHSVQTAKVQRLEEEATKRELEFEEQSTKLTQIQDLYTHLESERDEKAKAAQAAEDERNELQKLYKYAQLEIVESNNKEAEAIKESRKALDKVENMKILMEEIEQDRQKAIDQKEKTEKEAKALQESLNNANLAKDELHKDLGQALNQLAAYEAKDLDGLAAENETLKREITSLQEKLQHLDAEKSAIAENLESYTTKENEVLEEAQAEDQLMEELLDAARSALSEQGLYQDIAEDDLIEDRNLLETKLAELDELSARGGIELEDEAEEIEIDEEDVDAMERALENATEAMNMQGFFQDIEEAVLLTTDGDDVEDEELMTRALDETAQLMEGNPFFTDLSEEELVEDPELLLAQLQQEPEVAARGFAEEPEEEVIEWNEEEDELMSRALESANIAMNSEGLYTSIDPSKLMEPKEEKVMGLEDLNVDPKYKTALEQYVVAELGKSIPKANEMAKDDLKKINGIGGFIEDKLNYLGFYTYEQIASLSDEAYRAKLMAALGLSADAIDRDQWVTQAKALMTKQKISDLTKDININKLFKK
jgi:predicted flap endonuclease-1-like 5' DNA nuclease